MTGSTVLLLAACLLLACMPQPASGQASRATAVTLYNDLFDSATYNQRILPVNDIENDKVTVSMQFELYGLVDVNENDQTLTTICSLRLTWIDEFLKFTPTSYQDIYGLTVFRDDIWMPDITVSNKIQEGWELGSSRTPVDFLSDGSVTFKYTTMIESSCTIVVTYYPFDTQVCDIVFTTEVYSALKVEMESQNLVWAKATDVIRNYNEDGGWAVAGYKVSNSTTEDYKRLITYSFILERRQTFYLVTFLMPIIFLGSISTLPFVSPLDLGHQTDLCIQNLLTYAVYVSIVADYLPDTSLQMSLLALYLTVILGLTTVTAIASVPVMILYHKPGDQEVGPKVTKVVDFWMKISCLGTRKVQKDAAVSDNRVTPVLVDTSNPEKKGGPPIFEDEEEMSPMTWQMVAEALSWFCFIFFSLVIAVISVAFIGSIVDGGCQQLADVSTGDVFPPANPDPLTMTGVAG